MNKRKFKNASIENLKQEALKYNSKTEFFKKSRSAYKECLSKNIMNEVCSHMPKNCRNMPIKDRP